MQPTRVEPGDSHLEQQGPSEQLKQQQQLRLLSLVESAETKLKRKQAELELERQQQQRQQQQQHQTSASNDGPPPTPADPNGLLQVGPGRRLSASLGWQMKSPAFVTLNEGELERLATDDGEGAPPPTTTTTNISARRRSSGGLSGCRSLRSQEMSSSCVVKSRSPPGQRDQQQPQQQPAGPLSRLHQPSEWPSSENEHQPLGGPNAIEQQQQQQLLQRGNNSGEDKLDKNDIGHDEGAGCLSQRRDYASTRAKFNSSSTASSSSTSSSSTSTTASASSSLASNATNASGSSGSSNSAGRRTAQSPANLIVVGGGQARKRQPGPNEGANKLMLGLREGEGEDGRRKNDNEIGQLSDCVARSRRKSTSGSGRGAANYDLTAAAQVVSAAATTTITTTTRPLPSQQQASGHEGDERQSRQVEQMLPARGADLGAPTTNATRDVVELLLLDKRRRDEAKNMTNRRIETTSMANGNWAPAERTTMNAKGEDDEIGDTAAAAGLLAGPLAGGEDKDKIDGRQQLEDDGRSSLAMAVSAGSAASVAIAGRRMQASDDQAAETKLNRTRRYKLEGRDEQQQQQPLDRRGEGEVERDNNKRARAADELRALMLRKSVNDYGLGRQVEFRGNSNGGGYGSSSGDVFMGTHTHVACAIVDKDDYQQQQQHKQSQLTREQQQQQPDCRSDDRGGPTPTNDLIRTLLQRDRRAFERPAKSGSSGRAEIETEMDKDRQGDDDDQHYHDQPHHQQRQQRRPSKGGAQTKQNQRPQTELGDNDDTTRRKLSTPAMTTTTTTMNGKTTTTTTPTSKLQSQHYSDFNGHNNNSNNNNGFQHRPRDDAIEINARRHSSVLDLDLGSLMISNNNNKSLRHQYKNQGQQQQRGRRLSGNCGSGGARASMSPLRLAAQAIESMQQQAAAQAAGATPAPPAASSSSSGSGSGSASSGASSSCSSAAAAASAFQLPRPSQTITTKTSGALAQFNKCLDFTSNITRRLNENNEPKATTTTTTAGQQQPVPQVRRHSTYMLPLLLLNKRQENSTESDDEDDDDEGDITSARTTAKLEDDSAAAVVAHDKNKRRARPGPKRWVAAAAARKVNSGGDGESDSSLDYNCNDDDDDDNDDDEVDDHDDDEEEIAVGRATTKHRGHHRGNLPNSASSPSALSTPTNEIGLGRGGCGGPCCSHQAELFKLATDSALLSRQLFSNGGKGVSELEQKRHSGSKSSHYGGGNGGECDKLEGLFGGLETNWLAPIGTSSSGNRPNEIRKSVADVRRDSSTTLATSKQQQQQQQQQVISRHRAGSNPLDRVCKLRPHQVVHLIRHTQQQQHSQQQQQQQLNAARSPNWAGKRHSIINLIAGSAGQTVTSRGGSGSFGKRRSLAASGGGGGLALQANEESLFSNSITGRQRARRLTSGGELTTASTKNNLNTNSIISHQPLTMMRGTMHQANNELNMDMANQSASSHYHHLLHHHQNQHQYDPLIPESGFKIVVMGTSGSGKTAIIQRFLYGTFSSRHLPTVEDTYFIEFPHKKNTINISVSDTSGTYQFPAMRRLAINSGDAFILVYSVDDPQSFDNLEQLRQTILDEREQAYLESIAVSDSSSTSSSTSALTSLVAATSGSSSGGGGRSGSLAWAGQQQQQSQILSSLASKCSGQSLSSTAMNNSNSNISNNSGQQQHNQLHSGNLGLNSSATPATSAAGSGHQNQLVSPSRNWSLAALFGGHSHHHQNHNSNNNSNNNNSGHFLQQQQQQRQTAGAQQNQSQQQQQQSQGANAASLLQTNQLISCINQQHHHSSIGSSLCSTGTSSCSSSADNSRRSSISAAEAALKTRRTRKPPMVIVANKHDLPKDKHLVNSDEIEALAVIDWNNGFVRASAALNWNIDEIFQQVLMQARQPPTLAEAIVSKRRKSLPPKLPHP